MSSSLSQTCIVQSPGMDLTLNQFDYTLPPELIAHHPAVPRDHSRLLLVDRHTQKLAHHHFYELPMLLKSGDVIVRNNTKVLPARIVGTKPTGGHVELLLLKRVRINADSQSEEWECLSKPGLKLGQEVRFTSADGELQLKAKCLALNEFSRVLSFSQMGDQLLSTLDQLGRLPLPPYIHWDEADNAELQAAYQTTYAKVTGSAAAPTAGLHFTPEVDAQLRSKGIEIHELTLHVGLGTFLPVKTDNITDHQMHSEWFSLDEATAQAITQARQAGRRIIAVGTTTCRVLETQTTADGITHPASTETAIFIYPGYRFKSITGLITNFHLPKSSLVMLVSAFSCAPNTPHPFTTFSESPVGRAYNSAIENNYRFYSFGDSMLIL
jgi:S-adenosylmethionine:tRNA ribosyltransferase-isomerase